jgi:thiol-disulfide isomerase/thioredoxin
MLIAALGAVSSARGASAAGAPTQAAVAKPASADPRAGQGPQGRGLTIWLSAKPVPVPPYSVTGINGATISSSDGRGQVVLLNFWATWCVPCRQEIPALLDLQARYRGRLLVVGLSVDEGPADKVKQFVKEHQMSFPVAIADAALQDRYGGLPKLPSTFVVNQTGRIVDEYRGALDVSVVEQQVRSLVGLPTEAKIHTETEDLPFVKKLKGAR